MSSNDSPSTGRTSSEWPESDSRTSSIILFTETSTFAQRLVDHGMLPEDDDGKYDDYLSEIRARIAISCVSLSVSQCPRHKFKEFRKKNRMARTENDIMAKVMPFIIDSRHNPIANRLFTKLASMTDYEMTVPRPDFYEGSCPSELDGRVREDLSEYIAPSADGGEPILPNNFTEVMGPHGSAAELHLRARYIGAHGVRAMHQILSYGQETPRYDREIRSFVSTYCGDGTLKLYASFIDPPAKAGDAPTYRIALLRAFCLEDGYDQFREGICTYRNLQALAKEERDDAIAYANAVYRSGALDTFDDESPAFSIAQVAYGTFHDGPAICSVKSVKQPFECSESTPPSPKRRRLSKERRNKQSTCAGGYSNSPGMADQKSLWKTIRLVCKKRWKSLVVSKDRRVFRVM